MKQPNVPMNHPITTCRHKVDKKKFDSGWDRIWGKKNDWKTAEYIAYDKSRPGGIGKTFKVDPDDE